jgi:hypothetical protein
MNQQLHIKIAAALRQRAILLTPDGHSSVGPFPEATDPCRCERYAVIICGKAWPMPFSIDTASFFISMVGQKQATAALTRWEEDHL